MDDIVLYLFIAAAAICMGLAKGGLSGVGLLSIPILSQVMSPVRAVGLMLPFLLFSDVIAVRAYWRFFDGPTLRILMPAGLLGVGIGWLFAAWVSDDAIRLLIGLMSLAFSLDHWIAGRASRPPAGPDRNKGFFWGTIAGMTSFFANVGGPPFQVYMVPLRLDRRIYTGTAVVFFAAINVAKIGPFFFLGQITAENLTIAVSFLPLTIAATYAGVWVVRRINEAIFYRLLYASIFLIGIKMTYDGVAGLL